MKGQEVCRILERDDFFESRLLLLCLDFFLANFAPLFLFLFFIFLVQTIKQLIV
jgi:hypothetical protein